MSNTPDPADGWVKSSYSGNGGGQCLEWQPSKAETGVVPVRDSKDPAAGTLTFGSGAWASFISLAKAQSV